MKISWKWTILICALVFCDAFVIYRYSVEKKQKEDLVSEETAPEIVKSIYTDLMEYPSVTIPPKLIQTKQAPGGWYVGFIQEGVEQPILTAHCFFVNDQKSVTKIGLYAPDESNFTIGAFSIPDCSVIPNETPVQKQCVMNSCHGLNYTCGGEPPRGCTEIYMLGDACLKYATCGIAQHTCQPTENERFSTCRSCVEACMKDNSKDSKKTYTCEKKCVGE